MDFLNYLQMPFGYILPFIAALTVIVFVHELGHFVVARWCGVAVEVFSIGFGREIYGWNDRHGTRWKICWLPLGGYVKFEGDANPTSFPQAVTESAAPRSVGNFHGKSVWRRAAVVAAGPIANFILSILIFASVFAFVGVPMSEPRVGEVLPGSAAEAAGIKNGDLIAAIDGQKIESFNDIVKSVQFRAGEQLNITIDRNGTPIDLRVVAGILEEPDGFGGKSKRGLLGISPPKEVGALPFHRLSLPSAIVEGTNETWRIISVTFKYLGKLVQGNESSKQIGGPISIAKMVGDAASTGFIRFAISIAILSTSVGLINLFPIPMLDGGHLVYYAIETVSGKPLGQQAQEWGFRLGLSLVAMLMAFGFWNDLTRLFAMMVGS
jgi:regulator of sigma E protease